MLLPSEDGVLVYHPEGIQVGVRWELDGFIM